MPLCHRVYMCECKITKHHCSHLPKTCTFRFAGCFGDFSPLERLQVAHSMGGEVGRREIGLKVVSGRLRPLVDTFGLAVCM